MLRKIQILHLKFQQASLIQRLLPITFQMSKLEMPHCWSPGLWITLQYQLRWSWRVIRMPANPILQVYSYHIIRPQKSRIIQYFGYRWCFTRKNKSEVLYTIYDIEMEYLPVLAVVEFSKKLLIRTAFYNFWTKFVYFTNRCITIFFLQKFSNL